MGDGLRIGRGQCVEQYGTGEAYLPVLEALARMAREPRGDAIVRVLRQYAPSWLAQLPAVLTDDNVEAVQRRAQGTTRERMLRELAEALDVVSVAVYEWFEEGFETADLRDAKALLEQLEAGTPRR
jgi:hypothetical protein